MPTLTPAQIDAYYASQSGAAKPLSPTEWLAQSTAKANELGYASPDDQEIAGAGELLATSRDARQDFSQESSKLDGKIATLAPPPTGGETPETGTGQASLGFKMAYMADGTQVQIPDTSSPEQYGYSSTKPSGKPSVGAEDPFKTALTEYTGRLDSQLAENKAFYDDFKLRQEETTRALISSIQKKYEARRAKMEDINKRMLEGKRIAGITAGRQRYAPGIEEGLLSAEEMDGQARLAEIDAEELSLIAQAKAARDEASYKAFHDYMARIKQLNDDKLNTITKLHQLAIDQDKLLEDKRKNAAAEARLKQQDAFKLAEGIAGSVYEGYQGFETEAERLAFIQKVSEKYGVDPAVIYDSMLEYGKETKKSALELENIQSQITSREEQTKIDRQREARLAEGDKKEAGEVKVKDVFSEAQSLFEYGNEELGFNGRGTDGYVDPNLYIAIFKKIEAELGREAAVQFLDKFPPEDNLNPANASRADLPAVIKNRMTAI